MNFGIFIVEDYLNIEDSAFADAIFLDLMFVLRHETDNHHAIKMHMPTVCCIIQNIREFVQCPGTQCSTDICL